MGKVSKKSADYGPVLSRQSRRRCGTCSMFRAPGSCTHVAGSIDPRGHVCDDWEKKPA